MRALATIAAIASFGALAFGTACINPSANRACRVSADCASHICLADGTCAPEKDAGVEVQTTDVPTGCGNHDGEISRSEFPLTPGRMATFRVGIMAEVSTTGEESEDGTRTWNLSGDMMGDIDVAFETTELKDQWFAANEAFKTATFVARTNSKEGDETLFGVYRATSTAMELLGVVSRNKTEFYTELVYTPPVEVLRFPLVKGAEWQELSKVTGTTPFGAASYEETFTVTVDEEGKVVTPGGTFPVVRVHTLLFRKTPMWFDYQRHSHQFVSECGTVANLVSQDDWMEAEFTTAAEAWRVAP